MRKVFIIAAVTLLALPILADEEVRHAFRQSVPKGSIRRVVIDIPAGEVEVRNSEGRTIEISGDVTRSYDGYNRRSKYQAMVDDITTVITVDGSDATVERSFGPNAGNWAQRSFHTAFKVRVDVPRGMDVEIGTRYGELHLDGDFGDVFADLHAGEIHLRTPRASVHDLSASVRLGEVHADFGNEQVANEGVFPGSTHFYNANGHSHISVHTTAGEVHVTLFQ